MSKGKKISKGEKLAIVKRCLSGELGACEDRRAYGADAYRNLRNILKCEPAGG